METLGLSLLSTRTIIFHHHYGVKFFFGASNNFLLRLVFPRCKIESKAPLKRFTDRKVWLILYLSLAMYVHTSNYCNERLEFTVFEKQPRKSNLIKIHRDKQSCDFQTVWIFPSQFLQSSNGFLLCISFFITLSSPGRKKGCTKPCHQPAEHMGPSQKIYGLPCPRSTK